MYKLLCINISMPPCSERQHSASNATKEQARTPVHGRAPLMPVENLERVVPRHHPAGVILQRLEGLVNKAHITHQAGNVQAGTSWQHALQYLGQQRPQLSKAGPRCSCRLQRRRVRREHPALRCKRRSAGERATRGRRIERYVQLLRARASQMRLLGGGQRRCCHVHACAALQARRTQRSLTVGAALLAGCRLQRRRQEVAMGAKHLLFEGRG